MGSQLPLIRGIMYGIQGTRLWPRQCSQIAVTRQLNTTPVYSTDGVYQDLTNMRVRTPWIEALRQKQEEEHEPSKRSNTPATIAERDLKPKKMSDSFHRVVRLSSSPTSTYADRLTDADLGDTTGTRSMAAGQLP